ncbi:DUF4158 domain-containing protein [Streptomyces sp. NBC_01477]|uniref:DUF4158 domain-containing protein n=1 Tax=Streptomyces sp. NBC_01477 TaxID=2976015 RepID=UPI002E346EAC|nr:DUF4158 domain-containing protein [Streptomyces sp. NBC_01477]
MAPTSLDLDDLVEHWTLLKDEQGLVSGKRGATRLGFAVLLKFCTQCGRFPRGRFELPGEAVEFVARQVQVPGAELDAYEWSGRTVEYHRAQIGGRLGFRECSVADADKLAGWLAEHVACKERQPEQVRVELLARCRTESIEPPAPGRCDRIVGAALRVAEETLTVRISARITVESTERIVALVSGKENILFRLAEASIGEPEGTVREVVYPAVSGGEQTLRELVHEFKTRGPVYRRTVQTTLKASYTNHYRRGLIRLLDVLEFRSSNHTHRPVIEALSLVARYAAAGNTTHYPLGETVPVHKAMGGDWAEVVHRTDKRGRRRVVRMVYEVVAFQALRDQLKCKEIWVVGADKWRNPDGRPPQPRRSLRTGPPSPGRPDHAVHCGERMNLLLTAPQGTCCFCAL